MRHVHAATESGENQTAPRQHLAGVSGAATAAAGFGTANYLGNTEILTSLWDSLWTQQTLFACYFFTPTLIGVYCAFLWRMEHLGSNWNQVLSMPTGRMSLILAKLSIAIGLNVAMLVWTFLLYLATGFSIGLPASALPNALPLWFLGGAMGASAICALQLFLGLVFTSFAIPVGISMLGGIWGLVMLNKGWGLFCPYSLLSIGMVANDTDRVIEYGSFAVSCALCVVLFTAASALWMKWVKTK